MSGFVIYQSFRSFFIPIESRMYNRSANRYADDTDDFDGKPCCQRTGCRVTFLLMLTLLAIASSGTLAMIYFKDREKEKRVAEKQKGWIKTWKTVRPILNALKLEPISGIIISLITFAIDEYAKAQSH